MGRSRCSRPNRYSVYDAQDLTQGFSVHVIEHRIYERTDQAKGRFRVFLLTAMRNFVHNARDRERALKRGGTYECKGELFQVLKPFVRSGVEPLPSYEQLAPRLGMPPATVRSHVNRIPARCLALIRAERRRMVETEAQVDEELE